MGEPFVAFGHMNNAQMLAPCASKFHVDMHLGKLKEMCMGADRAAGQPAASAASHLEGEAAEQ
jgi:hypothetical protein